MEIIELTLTAPTSPKSKLAKHISCYQALLEELKSKSLPEEQVSIINDQTSALNELAGTESEIIKKIRKNRNLILKSLAKSQKLVTKGYYRNLYMSIGMSAFGIPLGLIFSSIIDNYGFIGVGLPIGMTIGIALGTQLDQKAKNEGRQLTLEIIM